LPKPATKPDTFVLSLSKDAFHRFGGLQEKTGFPIGVGNDGKDEIAALRSRLFAPFAMTELDQVTM